MENDWENEVLKWQMLFGNDWVGMRTMHEVGIDWKCIPFGLFKSDTKGMRRKLIPLKDRETFIKNWEAQRLIGRKQND